MAADRLADRVGGFLRVSLGRPRGTLGDNHQTIVDGEGGDVSAAHDGRCVRDGRLDVLRVIRPAVDSDVVDHASGDVQLTIETPGVECPRTFVRTAPIAAANIVALQPDFADMTVRKLVTSRWIDDHT
ncbi:Uncharacterised protein [Mycobacteroides abscessus subsp. massiliense]|nr:Uncharacterised protein [Mycobacteroides abscessus subsp. massiliense]